jgi:hypothetical protein
LRINIVKALGLLPPCVICIAGCVYPASTTYYEALDQSRAASNKGEEQVVSCPATNYLQQRLGDTEVWVIPQYHKTGSQIRINVSAAQKTSIAFQGWNVRFTSLTDSRAQVSVPLKFYMSCPKAKVESCPKMIPEPNNLSGSRFFIGVADVPPEFAPGFVLELQDPDTGQILDLKPQKFQLRTNVLLRGTFGCG